MVTHLATILSIIVFVPIIIISYTAITKKLRFRPVLYGLLSYVIVSVMTQLLLTAVNFASGGYVAENGFIAIGLWSIFCAVAVLFMISYIYKRLLDRISFRDSLGFGLGIGTTWLIATVGATLFFSLAFGMAITDGSVEKEMAAATSEAIEDYNKMKENFLSKGLMDYILLSVSGISLMLVNMAVAVLMFEYKGKSDKKYLFIAAGAEILVLVPFLLAAEAGFVNIYVQIFMALLAAMAVWYMVFCSKQYPSEEKTPFVRQSPLEGRDFTRRIKKRK